MYRYNKYLQRILYDTSLATLDDKNHPHNRGTD